MSVELDRETEQVIAEEVQAGRAPTANEFIRRAVKHFVIAREFGEEYTAEELEAKIARGIASLDRGDGVDGEEVFQEVLAELDEMEKARRLG